MPDESLKPAIRAALRMHEIGARSPYEISFAGKGRSGGSFGFMQGDLSAGPAIVRETFRAVLGAAGLGDLGRHMPDTDPQWAGADSLGILARVVALAAAAGWVPVNADCTVVAERPRLAPHVPAMVEHLTRVLGAPVNVKATRAEGLGALGRAEGIACTAVVLLAARGDAGSGAGEAQ